MSSSRNAQPLSSDGQYRTMPNGEPVHLLPSPPKNTQTIIQEADRRNATAAFQQQQQQAGPSQDLFRAQSRARYLENITANLDQRNSTIDPISARSMRKSTDTITNYSQQKRSIDQQTSAKYLKKPPEDSQKPGQITLATINESNYKVQRITPGAWHAHKEVLVDLYKSMPLGEIVGTMQNGYQFSASKAQYERQFKKWCLRRDQRFSSAILENEEKRERMDKATIPSVKGEIIDDGEQARIERKRELGNHDELLRSPTPRDISQSTPVLSPEPRSLNSRHSDDDTGFSYIYDASSLNVKLETLNTSTKLQASQATEDDRSSGLQYAPISVGDEQNVHDDDLSIRSRSPDSVFSIASSGSSLSLLSQYSSTEILSAIEELVIMFAEDEVLKPLFRYAFEDQAISAERFVRNFRRILKSYSVELREQAQEDLQKSAIRLIRSQAVDISRRISLLYDSEYIEKANCVGKLGSEVPELSSEDEVDQTDLPDLISVKTFLLSGRPFENLRGSVERLVRPSSGAHTMPIATTSDQRAVVDNDCVSFSSLFSRGWWLEIGRIWNSFWEPPIDQDKVRIRWTCQCGTTLWDDFQNLRPGATEDLRKSLAGEGDSNPPESQDSDGVATSSGFAVGEGGNIGLPAPANSSTTPSTIDTAVQSAVENPAQITTDVGLSSGDSLCNYEKFLLLCFCRPNDTVRLLQLNVEQITNDFELFRLLQETYNTHKGLVYRWVSTRKIISIKFRKFERHPRERVVILSANDILPDRINPAACHRDHTTSKCDTAYDIQPVPPDTEPYIGRNGLVHLLNHPHELEEQGNNLPPQTVWLKRFPKKERTRLTSCPPYQYGLGWGIEFVEGWDISWLMRLVFFALLIVAAIFLVCWWRLHGDLQGAASMAALLVAYATLLMSTFAASAVR